MGLPIADACIAVARRTVSRLEQRRGGVFLADRNHIHHRLLAHGIDHGRAVLILYGAGVLCAAGAFASLFLQARYAALFIVAVLIAGAVAYASRDDGNPAATRPRRTTTTTPDTATDSTDATDSDSTESSDASPPADLEHTVAEIKRFDERERGHTFNSDVPLELLDGPAFDKELLKGFEETVPETRELEQVLKSLGLVPRKNDIVADMRELLSVGVLGFYDQETKQLVVRGSDTTPLVRKVLAHELTHALDDQWFNLDRPQLDTADDESGFAFDALVEGSARAVEQAYYDKVLTSAEQRASDAAEADVASSAPQIFTLPIVLLALLNAPYDAGSALVARLDEDGTARLDEAFAHPPVTSEQVIAPEKFLAGEGPVAVPDPQPLGGLPVANRGSLGVVLLEQVLEDGMAFDATVIDKSLEGWGGDRYVTWIDGDRTCLLDVLVGDDAAATGALLQRFQDWAAGAGVSATVTPLRSDPGSPFTITSCSS
jgi:hypothetical protein